MLKFNFFSTYPKIKIGFNRFLDPVFTFYCKNNPDLKKRGWNDWIPPTNEEISERVIGYKKEWEAFEKKLLRSLYKISGLKFKRNIIDVHIVSGNPRQFSWPIVIKSGFKPEEFVDTLFHELIHVLFSDNKAIIYSKFLQTQFPNENKTVQNHVVLFAILKFVYTKVLRSSNWLDRNREMAKKHSSEDYVKAWEIVDKIGFEKIIIDFKKNNPPI